MKKSIVFLLIFLCATCFMTGCNNNENKVKDERKNQQKNFQELYLKTKKTEYSFTDDGIVEYEEVFHYDEKGRIKEIIISLNNEINDVEQIHYNEQGFISEIVSNQYSEKGLETAFVMRIVCDEKGRVIESKPTDTSVIYVPARTIIYDDFDNIKEIINHNDGVVSGKDVMTYGEDNNVLSIDHIVDYGGGDVSTQYYREFFYDDSNKLYQFSTFFPKGEGVRQKTYGTIIYDDEERISRINCYDSMMAPIDESRTFEYDETGNLIEDTIYNDNDITKKCVYSYEKRKVILDEVYSSMTFFMDLYDSSASNYYLIFQ